LFVKFWPVGLCFVGLGTFGSGEIIVENDVILWTYEAGLYIEDERSIDGMMW
jgi:hypothetical protein